MNAAELAVIVEAHGKWRRGEEGGSRADLTGADLTGADLARADLTGADLAGADLTGADLTGADLAGADLTGAIGMSEASTDYAARAAAFRARHPEIPVVEALDAKILDAITVGGGALNMGAWHLCNTTHCRAGWAIHLAGKAGYALEAKTDSRRAGAMIYRASVGRVPHFFATDEAALEDIKRCAAEQAPAPKEV